MTGRNQAEGRLRVAVAAPLSEENRARVRELEPRIDLVVDHDLLPPMRWPADFAGDPAWKRGPARQRAYEEAIDSADALYGVPDVDPAALARAVRANPRLRWVHTMAAGGGSQVKAAGLRPDELDRVLFTTSAGVHGRPLAEFAVFGVLAGAKDLPRLSRRQRDREWTGRWTMGQVSRQTVLVLGFGGIGRAVAGTLQALGATVIGTSRRDVTVPGVSTVIHPDRITEVAPAVDAVVNTLPGTEATEHLLGERFFDALRPGASLVNVGRPGGHPSPGPSRSPGSVRQPPRLRVAHGRHVARPQIRVGAARGDDGRLVPAERDLDTAGPRLPVPQPAAVLVPYVDGAGDAVLQHQWRTRLAVDPHPPGPAVGAVRVDEERALGAQGLEGDVGPAP
ncbi:phosphoglycerate dehydrogenase-like enzyme [Streptomyces rapamycinicus]|uniref:Phosphoglycerate dehydrogenase-like enzyme n=1 Tax=Streptomyces rapamycinicus TaxID=1226757 RepID=A0ABR6LZ75_9ACTN|nr:phosphoglycerate dehydrogenase-like enzyme [Streptomyces rapamycinicus]